MTGGCEQCWLHAGIIRAAHDDCTYIPAVGRQPGEPIEITPDGWINTEPIWDDKAPDVVGHVVECPGCGNVLGPYTNEGLPNNTYAVDCCGLRLEIISSPKKVEQ